MAVYGKKILTEHSSKANEKRGASKKLNAEKWLWEDNTTNDVQLKNVPHGKNVVPLFRCVVCGHATYVHNAIGHVK